MLEKKNCQDTKTVSCGVAYDSGNYKNFNYLIMLRRVVVVTDDERDTSRIYVCI